MKYVKEELSKLFKENYRALKKSRDLYQRDEIRPEEHLTHKRNLYPKLRDRYLGTSKTFQHINRNRRCCHF